MGLFLLLKNLQKFCSAKDSIFIEGGRGCYLRSAAPTLSPPPQARFGELE
jgi:hypothetical protein